MITKEAFILKNKKVVPADIDTWAKWMKQNPDDRIIAQDILPNKRFVSTVFLGVNMRVGKGKPLLFETGVFPIYGDWNDLEIVRYSTYSQAIKGHKKLIKKYLKL